MSIPRASLTNATTGERLMFQFNPATLRERIEVVWSSAQPIGGSHEVSHYGGTRSTRIPLELFYTLASRQSESGPGLLPRDFANLSEPVTTTMAELQELLAGQVLAELTGSNILVKPNLAGVERFLKSLCYGEIQITRGGIRGLSSPPAVIFDWPSVLQLEGHIENLDLSYERFDHQDLRAMILRAQMLFREDPVERIKTTDVRRKGSYRTVSPNTPSQRGISRIAVVPNISRRKVVINTNPNAQSPRQTP